MNQQKIRMFCHKYTQSPNQVYPNFPIISPGPATPQISIFSTQTNTLQGSPKPKMLNVKQHHKKFQSCECSPQPPVLSVKKQKLRSRVFQPPLPVHKESKPHKWKIDCYNQNYIKTSHKPTVDWIKFNIQHGIYKLWNRLSKHIRLATILYKKMQQPLSSKIAVVSSKISKIDREMQLLLRSHTQQKQTTKQQKSISSLLQRNSFMSSLQRDSSKKQKQNSKILKKFQDNRLSQQQHRPASHLKSKQTNNNTLMNSIQQALGELISSLAVESSERKENWEQNKQKMVRFEEQSKHLSESDPLKIKQFQAILKINHKRCNLVKHLLQKLQFLQSNPNLKPDQLQLLADEDYVAESADKIVEPEAKANQQIAETFNSVSQVSKQNVGCLTRKNGKLLSKKFEKNENCTRAASRKKTVRIEGEEENKHRASIELKMGDLAPIDQPLPASSCSKKLEKSRSRLKLKASISSQIQFNPSENGQKGTSNSLKKQKFSRSSEAFFVSKKVISTRKEGKNSRIRKQLSFVQSHLVAPKNDFKHRTGRLVSKKSQKKIGHSESQNSGFSFKSMKGVKSARSLKSIKTMKSITSTHTFNSRHMIKSLRTQRDLKFRNGRLKKISGIRNYRSILFRVGDLSYPNPSEKSNLLGVTELNISRSEDEDGSPQVSLNDLCQKSHNILYVPRSRTQNTIKHRKGQPCTQQVLAVAVKPQIALRKRNKQVHHKENINLMEGMKEHCERANQNQVQKNKIEQLLEQLFLLNEKKTINSQQFHKFKAMLTGKLIKASKKREQVKQQININQPEEDEDGKKALSPYCSLISLRKQISGNLKLNQINQYYQNLSRFMKEQETIQKTKHQARKEKELFNIKMYTTLRKHTPHPQFFPLPESSHRKQLIQKDF